MDDRDANKHADPGTGAGKERDLKADYEEVISTYYKDEKGIRTLIALNVDTKFADSIAEKIADMEQSEDVWLVTGDVDIFVNAKFPTYREFKKFIVDDISRLEGIKKSETLMVVTVYKHRGIRV